MVSMASASRDSGTRFAPRSTGEWICFALIGGLLALAGAYGTGDSSLAWRFAYWISMLLAGGVAIGLLESGLARRRRPARQGFVRAGAIILVTCLPIALAAWLLSSVMFGHALALDDLPEAYVSAATICAVLVAILSLLRSRGLERKAPPARAMPAFFAGKVPLRLSQATLLAARAEDHYVRLYTSEGEALVLARFGDALAALAAMDGAQVHRSWWVARAAIGEARWLRGGGTVVLTTGIKVPVSRAHAPRLKGDFGLVAPLQNSPVDPYRPRGYRPPRSRAGGG
jgi:hypothetical protein